MIVEWSATVQNWLASLVASTRGTLITELPELDREAACHCAELVGFDRGKSTRGAPTTESPKSDCGPSPTLQRIVDFQNGKSTSEAFHCVQILASRCVGPPLRNYEELIVEWSAVVQK